jgi:ribosomal protein S18 acetylase RimI-like enzyme
MQIRPFLDADLSVLVELTVETFRRFYEDHVRPVYGAQLFELHHGQWQQDYRDELSTLRDPATGRWIAVAEVDGAIAGLVAWNIAERRDYGRIYLLAVSQPYRRGQVGRQLCLHALEAMKADGVEVVELGTGEDRSPATSRGSEQCHDEWGPDIGRHPTLSRCSVDDFSLSRQCWPYAPRRRAFGRSSVMGCLRSSI